MAKKGTGFVNQMEFNKKLNGYTKSLRGKKKTIFLRALALGILTGVVYKTPVKTGRARGGWSVNMGDITPTVIETPDTMGAVTVLDGLVKINHWISLGAKNVLFIFNNVPYILDLENGNSSQAPNGMLKVTLTDIAGFLGIL